MTPGSGTQVKSVKKIQNNGGWQKNNCQLIEGNKYFQIGKWIKKFQKYTSLFNF